MCRKSLDIIWCSAETLSKCLNQLFAVDSQYHSISGRLIPTLRRVLINTFSRRNVSIVFFSTNWAEKSVSAVSLSETSTCEQVASCSFASPTYLLNYRTLSCNAYVRWNVFMEFNYWYLKWSCFLLSDFFQCVRKNVWIFHSKIVHIE